MSVTLPKRLLRTIVTVLGFGLFIGPWPALTVPYRETASYRVTVDRIGVAPRKFEPSRFQVGIAQVELTMACPVPLAGFIGQITQPYENVNASCFAKALTIVNASSEVSILAVDLLLINDELARAVLVRTGLKRDQIYFTATHSHSGPGGWANHPLERLVAGTYDPEVFETLATQLAAVITASRAHLSEAEVGFVQTIVPDRQRNRIAPGEPTNDKLSAWVFRSCGSSQPRTTLATLVSFRCARHHCSSRSAPSRS